jgi:tetratricopeptide (TPR) repeat protein
MLSLFVYFEPKTRNASTHALAVPAVGPAIAAARNEPFPSNPFIINISRLPHKCCIQKTYRFANSFRIRTYKKPGGGGTLSLTRPTPFLSGLSCSQVRILPRPLCRIRRTPFVCSSFIARFLRSVCLIPVGILVATATVAAQTRPVAPPSAAPTVEQAIDLAAKGRCQEALPVLKKSAAHLPDKDLKYRVAMATVRCAMSLDQAETAVTTLLLLNREFPHDPQVLYITTHYYGQLASRAAQELAVTAPSSYQAHELEAEAMESQGKWDEAAAEYKKILEQNPKVPGIHFRLGRVALSKSESPANTDEAKKEFEEELKIDPANAAAEFSLGEIARRAGQWEEAILRFTNASKLDPGFAEAFVALGMSLNAAERFSEAINPLERFVKMLPADPAGHYQLSIAYARTGRKEEATREMAIQRQILEKSPNGTRPKAK